MGQITWQHHELGIDEKFTISLSDIFRRGPATPYDRTYKLQLPEEGEFKNADIGIVVDYKPLLLEWLPPRSKEFRFEAHQQTNGKFYWYSLPLR